MAKQEMTYEQAMQALEQTVAQLESGSADMDEAFALYEKGIELVKYCENYLNEKQKLLKADENDEI